MLLIRYLTLKSARHLHRSWLFQVLLKAVLKEDKIFFFTLFIIKFPIIFTYFIFQYRYLFESLICSYSFRFNWNVSNTKKKKTQNKKTRDQFYIKKREKNKVIKQK